MEKNISKAFVDLQGKLRPLVKDGSNPHFKSSFATLKCTVDMLRPLLVMNGLGFAQSVVFHDGEKWMQTVVIHAASGETLTCEVPFSSVDNKPQSQGSAITYAKRYGLHATFGIVSEDDESDDDGNAASAVRGGRAGNDF